MARNVIDQTRHNNSNDDRGLFKGATLRKAHALESKREVPV